MIKATELRIGNLVLNNGTIAEVECIDKHEGVLTTANFDGNLNGDITPIPLTPEWLEKFGFVEKSGYWNYHGEPGFVLLKDGEGGLYIGNPVRTHVKTVHGLQNLYFALTEGIELNVKL